MGRLLNSFRPHIYTYIKRSSKYIRIVLSHMIYLVLCIQCSTLSVTVAGKDKNLRWEWSHKITIKD